MNREEEKKNPGYDQNNPKDNVNRSEAGVREEDGDQVNQPGNLDKIEGRMNNGEIGGGLRKEND